MHCLDSALIVNELTWISSFEVFFQLKSEFLLLHESQMDLLSVFVKQGNNNNNNNTFRF